MHAALARRAAAGGAARRRASHRAHARALFEYAVRIPACYARLMMVRAAAPRGGCDHDQCDAAIWLPVNRCMLMGTDEMASQWSPESPDAFSTVRSAGAAKVLQLKCARAVSNTLALANKCFLTPSDFRRLHGRHACGDAVCGSGSSGGGDCSSHTPVHVRYGHGVFLCAQDAGVLEGTLALSAVQRQFCGVALGAMCAATAFDARSFAASPLSRVYLKVAPLKPRQHKRPSLLRVGELQGRVHELFSGHMMQTSQVLLLSLNKTFYACEVEMVHQNHPSEPSLMNVLQGGVPVLGDCECGMLSADTTCLFRPEHSAALGGTAKKLVTLEGPSALTYASDAPLDGEQVELALARARLLLAKLEHAGAVQLHVEGAEGKVEVIPTDFCVDIAVHTAAYVTSIGCVCHGDRLYPEVTEQDQMLVEATAGCVVRGTEVLFDDATARVARDAAMAWYLRAWAQTKQCSRNSAVVFDMALRFDPAYSASASTPKKDLAQALQLYGEGAALADVSRGRGERDMYGEMCRFNLAVKLFNGHGVVADHPRSLHLHLRCIEGGLRESVLRATDMYRLGQGVRDGVDAATEVLHLEDIRRRDDEIRAARHRSSPSNRAIKASILSSVRHVN
eukprot:SAG31_NODE_1124_length_9772_cov_11.331541_6_plen_621_part_00